MESLPNRIEPGRRLVALGAIVAFVIGAIAAASPVFAQTGDATLTALTGSVRVLHAGKTSSATSGMAVFNGDEIDTGPGASATVTLIDKSTLEIGELSKVRLDIPTRAAAGTAMSRIHLLAGVVRSYVVHAVSGTPNYEVQTPNAVAAARGTKYDVSYQQGTERPQFKGCLQFTDVSVYDGTVDVANLANPTNTVQVKSGFKSTVPCLLLPTAPAAIVAGSSIIGTGGAIAAGAALVGGGVIGGYAASGGFGGGGGNSFRPPASPSR